MIFTDLIAAFLAVKLAAGYLTNPSGTAFPDADPDCSAWVEGTTGVTCVEVEQAIGITATQFETWVRSFTLPLSFDTDLYQIVIGVLKLT